MRFFLLFLSILSVQFANAQYENEIIQIFKTNSSKSNNDTLNILDLKIPVVRISIDSNEYYIANCFVEGESSFYGLFKKENNRYVYYNFEHGIKNEIGYISYIQEQKIINFVVKGSSILFITCFEKGFRNWHGSDYLPNNCIDFDSVNRSINNNLLEDLLYKKFIHLSKGIRTLEEIKRRCW